MNIAYWQEIEFLIRIILAAVCGGVIGYERRNRKKMAGIRTHLIVALGSALIMIVSKYGFSDILGLKGIALDPSRIAAQIVTGVGFLGAGIIFVRHETVNGLTTAAGIWATAAVGMAIGAGLYTIGVATAVVIILVQIVLHQQFKWLQEPIINQITIQIQDEPHVLSQIKQMFEENGFTIEHMKASKGDGDDLSIKMTIIYPLGKHDQDLLDMIHQDKAIHVLEF